MLTAMRAVDNVLHGTRHDLWAVNVESVYHEEHVREEQPYRRLPENIAPRGSPDARPGRVTRVSPALPSISVIVPATNQPATLDACLEGARVGMGPRDELVVVDDVELSSPSRIRNLGARRARCDVLLFVDADIVLHVDAMESVRAAFADFPDVVAVFGSYD